MVISFFACCSPIATCHNANGYRCTARTQFPSIPGALSIETHKPSQPSPFRAQFQRAIKFLLNCHRTNKLSDYIHFSSPTLFSGTSNHRTKRPTPTTNPGGLFYQTQRATFARRLFCPKVQKVVPHRFHPSPRATDQRQPATGCEVFTQSVSRKKKFQ